MAIESLTALTEQDKQHLINKSTKVLPDNPSDKGFSASQIKQATYEPSVILFNYLQRAITEVNDFVTTANLMLTKLDTVETGAQVNVIEGVKVDGVELTPTNKKVNVVLTGKLDKITNSLSSGDVAAYVATNNNGSYLQNYIKVAGSSATAWTIPQRRENGEIVVGSPTADNHATNKSWVLANAVNLTGTQSIGGQKTWTGKNIYSDLNLYNGYLTTNSKNYFVKVGVTTNQYVIYKLPYAFTDVGAKTYTLAVDEVATQSAKGLMSADDKAHLDALYSLLGDEEDADTVVNTINEVLEIFNAYPEGVTIANALALKQDVISDLTSIRAGASAGATAVQPTRTIAGIPLSTDIAAQALTDALTFMNSTTDLEYVMED